MVRLGIVHWLIWLFWIFMEYLLQKLNMLISAVSVALCGIVDFNFQVSKIIFIFRWKQVSLPPLDIGRLSTSRQARPLTKRCWGRSSITGSLRVKGQVDMAEAYQLVVIDLSSSWYKTSKNLGSNNFFFSSWKGKCRWLNFNYWLYECVNFWMNVISAEHGDLSCVNYFSSYLCFFLFIFNELFLCLFKEWSISMLEYLVIFLTSINILCAQYLFSSVYMQSAL